MTYQGDLFRNYGKASARQEGFFPTVSDAEANLHCDECGEYLVRTDSYLCCPRGHGKLLEEAPSNEYTGGLCFPEED